MVDVEEIDVSLKARNVLDEGSLVVIGTEYPASS